MVSALLFAFLIQQNDNNSLFPQKFSFKYVSCANWNKSPGQEEDFNNKYLQIWNM